MSEQKMDLLFGKLPAEIRLIIYPYVFETDVIRLQPRDPERVERKNKIREESTFTGNLHIDRYPFLGDLASKDVNPSICRTCRLAYEESTEVLYSNNFSIPFEYIPALQRKFLPKIGSANAGYIKELTIEITAADASRPRSPFTDDRGPNFDHPRRSNKQSLGICIQPNRLSAWVITLLNTMPSDTKLSKLSLSLLRTESEAQIQVKFLLTPRQRDATMARPTSLEPPPQEVTRTLDENVQYDVHLIQEAFPKFSKMTLGPGPTISIEKGVKQNEVELKTSEWEELEQSPEE
ncbi:hypothetical protein MMC30_006768 [Trapelia coarctata]|nr:hypothetical protein [Trapelia coarctata]